MSAVVLSYGMGVDSTAILLRWLTDPTSRDFELGDLVVVTAQTGSEWSSSVRLVEDHVLPWLRAAGVRFVEIARAQKSQRGGELYAVLQDTRDPRELHPAGRYRLADEMFEGGTVPQSGGGHLCSIKSKAVPIEAWLADEFDGAPRTHAIGYAVGEESRSRKDDRVRAAKGEGAAIYPLQSWGWDRERAIEFIREVTGADWPKSACTFCPFAFSVKDRASLLSRFEASPAEAVEGLVMEAVALALNPRAKLFKSRTLRDSLADNAAALRAFELSLDASTWALYRVRRQFVATKRAGKFNANRSVEILATGRREEMEAELGRQAARFAAEIESDGPIRRAVVQSFDEKFAGAQEEILSIAPARAEAKAPRFDEDAWTEATPKSAAA